MGLYIKSALRSIRRSPFQAMAATFVLTITFFVITFLSVITYASNQILGYFETRPQIIIFLKDDVSQTKIDDFRNKLASDSRIKSVNYVSKEDALEIYKKATSDNPLLSELVSPSIFPASLEFSLNDISLAQDVINEVKKEDVVGEVGFTASLGGEDSLDTVVARLKNISMYVRIGGGAFSLVLAGTSFLVLLIVIGMKVSSRREEIEILNLIGATSSFIRNPIVIEAVFYCLGGVFLGWLGVFLISLYATPTIISYFGEVPFLPKDTLVLLEVFGIILAAEVFVGLIIATSGSLMAVSRLRKNK